MMNKKKKKAKNKIDYESFEYGQIKLERFDRFVRIGSNWGPGQFEEFQKKVQTDRPKIKESIDKKIENVISLIQENNSLELLSSVSIKNSFADPEKYKEYTHEGKECYIEYALSLVLSQGQDRDLPHISKETAEQFNSLIEEIYEDIMFYFSSEITEGKYTEIESDFRLTSIIRYLFVRGDSFIEHHKDLVRDVFGIHDEFLINHYGLSIDQVIRAVQHIYKQLNNNISNQIKYEAQFKYLHDRYKTFVEEKEFDSSKPLKEIVKDYNAIPEVKRGVNKLGALKNKIENFPFEIKPNELITDTFLELMSSNMGGNTDFAKFEQSPYWPTNNSIVYRKPIIEESGKYYCFSPQIIDRNMIGIIENWIQEADDSYFQSNYQKKRSEYLENKTLEYLKSILPDAIVYSNLFYYIEEKGEKKRMETDGIITYDDNIIIIESKAGNLTISTRRGSLDRMKKDVSKLVNDGYLQALRTKNYIENSAEPVFEDDNGNIVLVLKDKIKYNNIYLFNSTFENLAHLSIQLNSLKKNNLLEDREWPWSVFINDLRIISELIEFPSQFLHYIQRRLKANDHPQFFSTDELDFFMFYLYEGLYFENDELKTIERFMPVAYTEDLDRYYDFIAGRVKSGNKPQLKISDDYKKLVCDIEANKKYRFTKVTTTLLSFGTSTQQDILSKVKKIIDLLDQDGKAHDFSMYFNDMNLGITFVTIKNRDLLATKKLEAFCNLKMYQTKLEVWIVLFLDVNNNGDRSIDFRIYEKKWKYDSKMDKNLIGYSAAKITESKKIHKKIQRNEPCPCNSGLKYKKCCGKIQS